MKIGIIDYEGGNLASVAHAVKYLGFEPHITDQLDVLRSCDRIIFPGVGAAGATMQALEKTGLKSFIQDELINLNIPCLGICIGIQVLFNHSEEDDTETLGIIPGNVVKFPANDKIKVPQIGWNVVSFNEMNDPILKDVPQNSYFYFVNSFHVVPKDEAVTLGQTTYGKTTFSSMVRYKNWVATQFHMEKSGKVGLQLLNNFITTS